MFDSFLNVEGAELIMLLLLIGLGLVLAAFELSSAASYRSKLRTMNPALRWLENAKEKRRSPRPEDGALYLWLQEHLSARFIEDRIHPRTIGLRFLLVRYPPVLGLSPPPSSVRFAPALLTALGVLGTFWGITAGLQSLDQASIGDSTTQMMESIWSLLEGMKTAFNTSLVGLSMAALNIVVLALGARARRALWRAQRTRLDELAVLESPVTVLHQLASEDQAEANRLQLESARTFQEVASQLQTSVALIGESLSSFNADAVGKRVGEAVEQSLKPIFVDMHGELQSIQTLMANQNENIIRELMAGMREEVFEPVSARLEESADITREAATSVKTLSKELGDALTTIQRFQTDTLKELKEFSKELSDLLSSFREDTESVLQSVSTQITRSVDEGVKSMEAQREAFSDSAEQASTTFKGIREQLEAALEKRAEVEKEMLSQTRAGVEEILGKAQTSFEGQSQTLRQVGEESAALMDGARTQLQQGLEGVDAALQASCQTVQTQLDTFRERYQEQLNAFFEQQNTLLEQTLGQQRDGLSKVVTELQEVFVEEYTRRTELKNQLDESFQKLAESSAQIQELAEAVGLGNSAMMSQMEETARSIGGQVKSMERQLREMDSHFTTMLSVGEDALRGYVDAANNHNGQFYAQLDDASAKVLAGLASAAEYLVASEQQRRLHSPPVDNK